MNEKWVSTQKGGEEQSFKLEAFCKILLALVGRIMAPQRCPCPNPQNLGMLAYMAKGTLL